MAEKLVGSLNLAKLSNVGIMTIQGASCAKKCLVIPIEENDIFIKVDKKTTRDGHRYTDRKYCVGVEIYTSREVDQYGNTHYAKASVSKEYIDSHTQEEVAERNKIYLGNFKPVQIPSSNQASTVEAPPAVPAYGSDDDLPF